jgi:hypothetical protein
MINYAGVELAHSSSQWEARAAVLVLKKRILSKYMPITYSVVGVRINRKKYIKKCLFPGGEGGGEHLKKLKTYRDPYLCQDLPVHVPKNPIHLVTQSL